MIKIAVVMSPEPGIAPTLMKQCGVTHAVAGIGLQPVPGAGEDEQPWSYPSLMRAKTAYERNGFELAVIESRPPMEKIKLGLPGRPSRLAEQEVDVG